MGVSGFDRLTAQGSRAKTRDGVSVRALLRELYDEIYGQLAHEYGDLGLTLLVGQDPLVPKIWVKLDILVRFQKILLRTLMSLHGTKPVPYCNYRITHDTQT